MYAVFVNYFLKLPFGPDAEIDSDMVDLDGNVVDNVHRRRKSDVRDKVYNEEYFGKFILEESNRIDKFLKKLCNGEVDSERILPVKAKAHDLQLGILIAKYSNTN